MFSFKFIVIPDKGNALRLRITNNRKKAELTLGVSMSQDSLNNILYGNIGASPMHRTLVRQWQSQLEMIKVELLRTKRTDIDVNELKSIVQAALFQDAPQNESDDTRKVNWEQFYTSYVASKKNKSYRDSCAYTLKKMQQYCAKFSELTFDDITLKWLRDFDEKLIEDGASQNTRNIHFKNIRTCLNRAIDEELTTNYPFRRFKIRPEETRKRNLPVEELRRLFNYDVEPYQEIYRDMFKLIFMLIGINTIDLFGLMSITKAGRIEYKRSKTKKLYSIKVEPEALEIINKYRGENGLLSIADRWSSHRDFQKYCNIALKKIGRMERKGRGGKKEIKPEWPELSTYFARYSWATIAFNDCGIPKDVISQALGHSWGASVTEIYLNRDQKLVDEANRRVLDWVLYGKR